MASNTQLATDVDAFSLPMGKYLASSDKAVRDKAFDKLRLFLSSHGDDLLVEKEMMKLWKGLFFCFWHSDKPLVQQALATDFSQLLLTITSPPTSFQFLKGFWQMMVEQWTKIDHLRLDKFYMLVRRFVNATFRLLIKLRWDSKYVELHELILTGPGGPLFPDDQRIPTSLACHLGDIYLDELEKALESSPSPANVPIISLLYPFVTYASQISVNSAYKRIVEAVLDPFLSATTRAGSDQPRPKRIKLSAAILPSYTTILSKAIPDLLRTADATADTHTGNTSLPAPVSPEQIRTAFLKTVFETASQDDAREANRKKLYAFWKAAMAEGVSIGNEWDAS